MSRLRATLSPLVVGGIVAALAAPSHGDTYTGCRSSQLSASFVHVRGSDGAGQTSYSLHLKNRSRSTCAVSGLPGLQLLGAHGRKLPTHVAPTRPGALGALIMLAPGKSAIAVGRFDRSVPAGNEATNGPCEPTAVKVRVTVPSPSGGTVTGRLHPPTTVCNHGHISLGLLHSPS